MREQGWRSFGWYVWDQGAGLPGDWNGRLAPSHEWVFHFNRVAERARKTKDSKHAGEIHKGKGLRNKTGIVTPSTIYGKPYQDTKIPDSVIRISRQHGRISVGKELADHPAVFPVDLVSEMLTAFSDPDDVVYEPFCGSGTQLISAQKNGRTCLAMEIAPSYCDVAIQRWQNFSGQFAVLEGSGLQYEETAAQREQPSSPGLVAA
jgi:DNA modification methylase